MLQEDTSGGAGDKSLTRKKQGVSGESADLGAVKGSLEQHEKDFR